MKLNSKQSPTLPCRLRMMALSSLNNSIERRHREHFKSRHPVSSRQNLIKLRSEVFITNQIYILFSFFPNIFISFLPQSFSFSQDSFFFLKDHFQFSFHSFPLLLIYPCRVREKFPRIRYTVFFFHFFFKSLKFFKGFFPLDFSCGFQNRKFKKNVLTRDWRWDHDHRG